MPLAPGTRLGPYEIVAPLGAGGMGEVYRARDTRLERSVALKILPTTFTGDANRLQRFEHEARILSALNHPNLLAIHDVGAQNGTHYLVSEFLEGQTLREKISGGPLPQRRVTEYALEIAKGLAAAHLKGIVHRDLKPDNIFLTADGRVKILDFGLARFKPPESNGEETITQTVTPEGTVMGTVGYISPEQVRGAAVGPGSDLFSLGCVLYEMIAGRRAFRGPTSAETLSAILRDAHVDLSVSGVRVPPELDRLISHCLEKSPEERFQSARDLAFDLKAMLTGSGAWAPAQPASGKAIDS